LFPNKFPLKTMYNTNVPSRAELPTTRQLLRSTLIAAVSAVVLLYTVVLPAEYGVDPTGIGKALGLTEMGEIKTRLAKEAAEDAAATVGAPPAAANPVASPGAVAPTAPPTAPPINAAPPPATSMPNRVREAPPFWFVAAPPAPPPPPGAP
jgi:hypothetical protein